MVPTTTTKRTYDHRIRHAICASGEPNGDVSVPFVPSRAHGAPDSDAVWAGGADARDLSGTFDCHTVTRAIREALAALRALDGRKAEALLVGLFDDLGRAE